MLKCHTQNGYDIYFKYYRYAGVHVLYEYEIYKEGAYIESGKSWDMGVIIMRISNSYQYDEYIQDAKKLNKKCK